MRAVAARTGRWRAGAVALGLVVAAVSLQWGALGRGVLLAAPLFALCVLTGVIVGELRVPAPAGPVRRAEVEVRRVRDYLPRRMAGVVAAAAGVLAALLVLTTAMVVLLVPRDAGEWAPPALARRP